MATPMSASTFKAILEKEGLHVVTHGSWETHNRGNRGTGWGPLNGVVIHHTGPYASEQQIIQLCYDGYSALPGPLCQGVIDKEGTVHLVGWGRCNHAGLGDHDVLNAVISENYGDFPPKPNQNDTDGNSRFIGFECINAGDGKDTWTKAQYDAMVKASTAICRYYKWTGKSVIGHKEWQVGKPDPLNVAMSDFRKNVSAALKEPPGGAPTYETYTVREGDTLFRIAAAFYHDGNKYTKIASVNNIHAPYTITVGQKLRIPK